MTLAPHHRVFQRAARILCHRSKRDDGRVFLWLQARSGEDILTPPDTTNGLEAQARDLDTRLARLEDTTDG